MASDARLLVARERVPMLWTEKAESERRCGGPPPWAAAMRPCAALKPVDFVVLETHIVASGFRRMRARGRGSMAALLI